MTVEFITEKKCSKQMLRAKTGILTDEQITDGKVAYKSFPTKYICESNDFFFESAVIF
jgi:hypothetical protein